MNKNSWKMRCVDNNNLNRVFTVGKIYEVKNGMVQRDCDSFTIGAYRDFNEWCEICKSIKWELIEDSFTKSDLQECDVVTLRDNTRLVYFSKTLINRIYNIGMEAYKEDMTRSEINESKYDIMQVYRNGILIFDRVEEPVKSPIQIEIESIEEEQHKLADRLSELRKGL